MYKSGVSISTDDRRNAPGYFAKRSRLLASLKEEATRCSSYNVVNKKHIIKSERKLKGPLVLSYAFVVQMLYFSQFVTRVFGGLHRICSRSNVRLTWLKSTLFCTQFSPLNTGNRILWLWNFKIFWGSMPPDFPRGTRLTAPCWYSRVLWFKPVG